MKFKAYLGDGVYVDFDGYSLVLTAENGISATDTIVLEPEVYNALKHYAETIHQVVRDAAQAKINPDVGR